MDGAVAIVLAAGRGERMDSPIPKALMPFDGATVVARAVERAAAAASVTGVIVVAPAGFEDLVKEAVEGLGVDEVVAGGETRQASVRAGLSAVDAAVERILCHDAARPLASPDLFTRTLEALEGWDGVVPVLRVVDTVKRVQDGRVEGTEPRDARAHAQKPPVLRAAAHPHAPERAPAGGLEGSDDALLLERADYRVRAIEGERTNLKITTPDDIRLAEALAR